MINAADHILEYTGAFRLLRKIATGGMATVYEAEHLGPAGFTKRVALKVIHPRYAREADWKRLFIDEAKLSANLVHGNIVQIYQLGEMEGQFYIAMEYIQGPTLRSMIDRHHDMKQPIPVTMAAYIASRVCRALDFAHNFLSPDGGRLDIVHRDVSPGNVMATWDGHIKLADFGIAKAATSFDPVAKHAMLIGKKHYMSPEQCLALDADGKSDVFSLAVVLYELLTLEPLFAEDVTILAIDEVTLKPIPSVRLVNPGVPPELDAIILAALSRDPAHRPTAAQMGRALDQWGESQRVVGTPDRLQEHLAALFPALHRRASIPADDEQRTSFSNFRGLRRRDNRGLLSRILGR
ncbi:MAG: serine/threonine-protein kinase [Gemmatimonadaceae bacterium]